MVPALSLWAALCLVCCLLLVGLAQRAGERTTAQSAADAAALAGAAEGQDSAARIAEANGATLVSYEQRDGVVHVRVVRVGVAAEARAERQIRPTAWAGRP